MQQHLMQILPSQPPIIIMAAYYHTNVTTDHIQQYLDENKSLILKIVESQNSGKISECAENQARLQRNLMYLAAIADSQPQPPTLHSQYAASGMLQAGAHYLQHQQQGGQQMMTPQSLMSTRSSMLYGAQPYPSLQQQTLHGQLGMSSGMMLQGEPHGAAAAGGMFSDFGRADGRGLGKQDIGSSGGDGEGLYLKSSGDDHGN